MDVATVERLYDSIMSIINGEDYESVMVALGAIHNEVAIQHTSDEYKLRALYEMMGDAAICMAALEDEGDAELEAEEAKKEIRVARKKTGNGPGPSDLN